MDGAVAVVRMDDDLLNFWADWYVAEKIRTKTGETFLQFIARKERELAKGVSGGAFCQPTGSVEIAGGAKS
jgi:hypothetical protein